MSIYTPNEDVQRLLKKYAEEGKSESVYRDFVRMNKRIIHYFSFYSNIEDFFLYSKNPFSIIPKGKYVLTKKEKELMHKVLDDIDFNIIHKMHVVENYYREGKYTSKELIFFFRRVLIKTPYNVVLAMAYRWCEMKPYITTR